MSKQFNYGGQAVMEGVMMRGSRHMAVAVRAPDQKIVLHQQPLNSPLYSGLMSRLPFVRGLGLLWDALGLGMRALMYSAKIAAGEDTEFSSPLAWGTVAVSMIMFVGLFFITPRLVVDVLQSAVTAVESYSLSAQVPVGQSPSTSSGGLWAVAQMPIVGNFAEGLVRLALVVGYIWAVGFIPDIQRVFAYHGAEHKTINAYEAGAPLTPQSIARFPLEHPRCGTGFLLVVVAISILIFSLLGDLHPIVRYAARVALVPVIAAIAYEYVRFVAAHLSNPIIRIIVKPQLMLQRLTTRQPDAGMLEVSLAAFKAVLESEGLSVPVDG